MSVESSRLAQLKRMQNRKQYSVEEYINGIQSGNTQLLSKAITLLESSKPDHHEKAQQIVEGCMPYSGNSIRIGITGVPGVGKSTFIEAFGTHVIKQNHKLAVLAIDPSSQVTKGSILGDKTRMLELSANKNAFIRPSPSTGSLGGVANATRESIILCEAAGYDVIFVETVGVGQSETMVHSMVDFFLLLMLAGAGDELQGIKRGIMEMADTIVINKADGDNVKKAKMARREYANAIHLFPPTKSGWIPQVETCSAIQHEGMDNIWNTIDSFKRHTTANGYFEQKRAKQASEWMHATLLEFLKANFYNNTAIQKALEEIEDDVTQGKINPFQAANQLFEIYKKD